jgi:hypothetical protein
MTALGREAADAWPRLIAAAEAILEGASVEAPELEGATIVGLGWATVEIERAERELASVLGGGSWSAAPRDALLGARAAICRLAGSGRPPQASLVVLEPDTEGRVAGSLARHGEGLAAIYLRARAGSRLAPGAFGIPAGGPLGRGRRLASGKLGEPSVVVLEAEPEVPAEVQPDAGASTATEPR